MKEIRVRTFKGPADVQANTEGAAMDAFDSWTRRAYWLWPRTIRWPLNRWSSPAHRDSRRSGSGEVLHVGPFRESTRKGGDV
jgi:hypothetical protein